MYTIYGKKDCPQCDAAKILCNSNRLEYSYLELEKDFTREYLIDFISNSFGVVPRQMPQIVLGDKYIGSTNDLKQSLTAQPK